MEMVLSPDLEQEMLLSNIKHNQQVAFEEELCTVTLPFKGADGSAEVT